MWMAETSTPALICKLVDAYAKGMSGEEEDQTPEESRFKIQLRHLELRGIVDEFKRREGHTNGTSK